MTLSFQTFCIRFLSVFFCWDFRLVPVLFTVKGIHSDPSIPEATVIPMRAVFAFVTEASRSAETAADAARAARTFIRTECEWATHPP